MKNTDVFDINNCVIKDEKGMVLARLVEDGDYIRVCRKPCCSIGTYFYILWHLRELGFDVR